MTQPLIFDAHEDLAFNMASYGRDYTRAAAETRSLETKADAAVLQHDGSCLVGWPDYQRGRVAVVFSTLFVTPRHRRAGEWESLVYADSQQAHKLYFDQLMLYHELTDRHPDLFRLIGTRRELEQVLTDWRDAAHQEHPVGLVPLMEGAEGIRTPAELDEWWQAGLRIIGLAWAGTRFCGGTHDPGPLTADGHSLLEAMADYGFILDISHMDPLSAHQALDLYPGRVIASHANAATLIPEYSGNRQLPDDIIRQLIERDGVIGLIPMCKFLDNRWQRGDSRKPIPLAMLLPHIEHICQIAGDARHVGFGSDFDGGFGLEAVPDGVDTIADLQKIAPLMAAKGYNPDDVSAIFHGNWLRILQAGLPE
jgi:membrane dipeptidase